MKLLSDFDGVWTDPRAEGSAQGEYLDRTLTGWTPAACPNPEHWIHEARAATLATPRRYGWLWGDRLSAFADEDPFIVHSALLHYLHVHQDEDAIARGLCEAVVSNGFESLDHFGGHTHSHAVEEVTASRGPGILAEAAEAGRRMLGAGLEVVVVSNSTPDKLMRWFEHARVPRTEHPERAPGHLRVRGSARKFVLGPTLLGTIDLGDTQIEIDRPSYETILRDERPDAVVGDVFSLDLALPLALKRSDPEWSAVRLFWLIHPYTPSWLQGVVSEHVGREVEMVTGGLRGLADLLAGQRRAS